MKKLLILFFGLSVSFCVSQNPYKLNQSQLRRLNNGIDNIQKYADSLNSFECANCKVLPDFFYNFNFDRENNSNWIGLHTSLSSRKLIIDKIDNESLLRAVLRSKDKRLRKRTKLPKKYYSGYVTIPFQEYSTLDLVKYRLLELENEENMGKKATNYPHSN